MQRLHHSKKEILDSSSEHWELVPQPDREFLFDVTADGMELSENKWKKMYAVLANLANATNVNYRVYRSMAGNLYDTTCHDLTTEENVDNELLHQDVVEFLEENTVDARLLRLKRWKLELDQLKLKIEQLSAKRAEVLGKYQAELSALNDELRVA